MANSIWKRLSLGAAAGLAGTAALQGLLAASRKWAPATVPPMLEPPGEFMVEQAEKLLPDRLQIHVPDRAKAIIGQALGLDYGAAFGMVYAGVRPNGGSPALDGVFLGLGAWAVGYLGWLQATGLMSPLGQQSLPEVFTPPLRHVVFGIVTVAAYNWLCQTVNGGTGAE